MTRTRHITRSAVVLTASALFAIAGAGTAALAFSEGAIVESPVAAAAVSSAPAPTAAELAAPAKARAAAQVEMALTAAAKAEAAAKAAAKKAAAKKAAERKAAAAKAAAAKKAAVSTKASSSSSKTVYIRNYVNGGGQAAIDQCKLVLWYSSPLWLAAHNYCGYQWMAFVATGTTVVVTSGTAAGTYKVTGHKRLTRQGGAMPSVNADLVLQTCVGSGTGLTLLQRV